MPRYREDTLIDLCARPWAALTMEHRRAAVAYKRRTVGDAVTDAALRQLDGDGAASLTDACLRVLHDPKLAYHTQSEPQPIPASEETSKKENPTMTTTAKTTAKTTVKTKPQPEPQPAQEPQPAASPQQQTVPERRLDPEKDVRAALMHLVATTGTLVAAGASTYPLSLAMRAQCSLVDLLRELQVTDDDDDDDAMEGAQ